ncbi:MAG: hypothetical protein SVM80_07295 [Halobacteriota archaeon]|nr:hypothetical protein [Halobacteriota archaeon]
MYVSIMGPPFILFEAIITLANFVLLIYLLYVYWGNYKEIKSKFALGLIIFIILLILQAFTSNPLLYNLWGFERIEARGLSMILPDFFEFVALIILLYISRS